jgi:hypothetical protein
VELPNGCISEVIAGIDLVKRFKPQAWVPHCQNTVKNSLRVSAFDLNFFWQGEMSPLYNCWFFCGLKMAYSQLVHKTPKF